MSRISIYGAGTWGLAIAKLLTDNGHQVTIWPAREESYKNLIETRGSVHLPGIKLDPSVRIVPSVEEAAKDCDMTVLAVASPYTRATARRISSLIPSGHIVVNVAKGIEADSLKFLVEQIADEIPQCVPAVLSGPSHAEEVSIGMPTTCVAGAASRKAAEAVQNLFMSPVFRVYTSPDVIGIELGGSLKNVIALAAGMADGLGYGDNTKAALITRGITEIARLGQAMGAEMQTLYGLSGIGDLIVTCASKHSRNRMAGYYMGEGLSMKEAMDKVQMVVEGVYSAQAALALSQKYGINMPIVTEVNAILFSGKAPADAVRDLMLRDRTIEHAGLPWPEDMT